MNVVVAPPRAHLGHEPAVRLGVEDAARLGGLPLEPPRKVKLPPVRVGADGEEVAAAAAALREKANIVPPSYVPVEEPVSEPEPVAPRTPFNTKPDDMVPL